MTVRDLMSECVVTVGQEEPVAAAARLLRRCNLGALPVCDAGGRMRGFVTDRDIVLRCVAAEADPRQTPVRDVMSRDPVTAAPDDEVERAAGRMRNDQVRRLPVVEGARLVGMFSLCDMARSSEMEAAAALSDISSNLRRRVAPEKNEKF